MPAVCNMKKDALIAAIQELGEEPPSSWGVTELRCRLLQMEEAQGITKKDKKTPLQRLVIQMNVASKKKENLQAFARQEMGLTITTNETVAQLQRQCMEKIYYLAPADAQDPVGFGEHSSLTYAEIKTMQPQYCQWVKTTAQEGTHCQRLGRLAAWLNQPEQQINKINTKGPMTTKTPSQKSVSAHSSSSATSVALQQTQEMMGTMVEVMKGIKEELSALKEERPHKKDKTVSSEFSMLTDVEDVPWVAPLQT